ncbi:alpha-galactosidase [Fusibacter bizertensis]
MIYIDRPDSKQPLFHVQTQDVSYIMTILPNGKLVNLHYGKKVSHTPYLANLFQNYDMQAGSSTLYEKGSNLTLDTLLLESADFGKGDYRQPSIYLSWKDGSRISDFVYDSFILHEGKVSPEGLPSVRDADLQCDTIEIILREKVRALTLHLFYTPIEDAGTICRFSRIMNHSESTIEIHNIQSLNVDFSHCDFEQISLDGMWIRERQAHRQAIRQGIFTIDSKKGVSGANHNPMIALVSPKTDASTGDAYGFALMYSGNFSGRVEVSPYKMTRVQLGISDFEFKWRLLPNTSFDTPEAVCVFSSNGLNGLSQNFHQLVNAHIITPKWRYKARPILINNWEATYFDFDQKKLMALAKEAKQLGIELFVLDDGWFKGRNDDTTSLGDWIEDPKKLPKGLIGLSKKIKSLGLDFGIWVEPEMVSENSELYKKHPDWAIKLDDRVPSYGRNQLVLDYTNPEVLENIYQQLHRLFTKSDVSYVKWDMNRNFTDTYSSYLSKEDQLSLNHRYVLGLYALLDRLCSAFPHILFESCSSGGNRYDLGMLYYMPQTWTSDNTDAVERIDIQFGTSFIFPPSTMGAHVSGRPSHQVLRSTPIETRFNVAAFGLLGYELDLTKLSSFDRKVIAKQIAFYKKHRSVLQFGTFYRHSSEISENPTIWSMVDEAKNQFIIGYYQKLHRPCPSLETIKVLGIDADALYEVQSRTQYQNIAGFGELINPYLPINLKDGGILQNIINNRYLYALEKQSFLQQGDTLMNVGLKLYAQFAGTGISDKTRNIGDFGSRLYVGNRRIDL